ncbi:hypothetical protein [Arhodomonas sp. SL1]|uniref:hypothetical protein n=1 Tax=Arhodomonas sp. SL1 TaxID=3425691 RepID=UPI003F884909
MYPGKTNRLLAYSIDRWQRGMRYTDALRQRAENMIACKRAGESPPERRAESVRGDFLRTG